MNERKKLKKQLGEKYIFRMYLSVNNVKKLLSENPRDKHDTLFASLTIGCVKINARHLQKIFFSKIYCASMKSKPNTGISSVLRLVIL